MINPGDTTGLSGPATRIHEHYVQCRYCGHRNRRMASYCEECGEKITLAAVARAYIDPVAQQFSWMMLLLLPTMLVGIVAFSFIAGGLGFGEAVRPVVDKLVFGLGALAAVIIGVGVFFVAYKVKPRR
jgi:hypothetical protein